MTFATPAALWLLIPLAFVLAERFRRRDRRRVLVGTMAIWRALAASEGRLRRRRRPPLEFVMESLLGLLLVLLASGPALERTLPVEVLALVDSGSAMQTPERRAALESALDRLERDSASPVVVHRVPPENESEAGPVVTDSQAWAPTLSAMMRPGRQVHLIADAVADVERLPAAAGLIVIDAAFTNVGITAVDVRLEGEQALVFVALAATAGARTANLRVVVRGLDGRLLGEGRFAPSPDSDESSLEIACPADLPGEFEVRLEGATGPDFDDRVAVRVGPAAVRPAVLPFAGAEVWMAALEASGLQPVRTNAEVTGVTAELFVGPAEEIDGAGLALVPAASGAGPGLAITSDPKVSGAPLQAVTGEVLADLPGLDRLPGRSGRYFTSPAAGVRILARRAGKAVIVLDPVTGRLLLADPESAAAWGDIPSFPLLADRLGRALAALHRGPRFEIGPLSSPGETEGRALDASSARPAAPVEEGRQSRDGAALLALLALVSWGILVFLRRARS